jgi:hypothetical protein
MNLTKLVSNLTALKNTIKRAVPDGGYVSPELLVSVKKSAFASTLTRYNLLNQLDNINVSTFDGTVNLTINGRKVNVATFTNYLNKGDLIGALKSIGIPKKNLNHAPIQQRAKQFKVHFQASKLNRLSESLAANKTSAAKLQDAFNLPDFTATMRKGDITRELLSHKLFTKRILAPLYHKLKANPGRIPWLKGLAIGSLAGLAGAVVHATVKFMQVNNGCWLYPKFGAAVGKECKVPLLTCNEKYKPTKNMCTTKCINSESNQEYSCFQEAALRQHCKTFKGSNVPLCGTQKSCSWACSNKHMCVPADKKLKCINYSFWEAFVAVTKNYLPNLEFNLSLVILAIVVCVVFLFWLLG